MNRTRKTVLLLVEGIHDETALKPALKTVEKKMNIRFRIMEGDPLADDRNKGKSAKQIAGTMVSEFRNRYKLRPSDILFVAQLTDTDGVFIPDNKIIIDLDIESPDGKEYTIESIKVKDKDKQQKMKDRNKMKKEHLNALSSINKIATRPYQIFYVSRELEHVLHNINSVLSTDEKNKKASEFSEKYSSFALLKKFFNNDDILVSGDYKQTWDYIKQKNHSLERNSNFHLFLKRVEEESEKLNSE